jgi:hypothetical protein
MKNIVLPAKTTEASEHPPGTMDIVDEPEMLREIPVSRRTMKGWRDSGKIPYLKIGKRVLYHRPSVREALLRAQRNAE